MEQEQEDNDGVYKGTDGAEDQQHRGGVLTIGFNEVDGMAYDQDEVAEEEYQQEVDVARAVAGIHGACLLSA